MRADHCSQCRSDKLLTDRRTSVAMFTATAAPSRVDKSGANKVRVQVRKRRHGSCCRSQPITGCRTSASQCQLDNSSHEGPAERQPCQGHRLRVWSFLTTDFECVADPRIWLGGKSYIHLYKAHELEAAREALENLDLGVLRYCLAAVPT